MSTGSYERTGLALPEALDEVHSLLVEVGECHPDVDAMDLLRLETALTELVGNIIEHGRPPGEVRYCLGLDVRADRLVALLSDDAVEGAPSTYEVDVSDALAESGRGLALADAIVDELVHVPTHPGNAWRVVQRRNG